MSAVCRLSRILLPIFAGLLNAGTPSRSQPPPQVPIRVETALVNVPVLVEDRNGAHVPGLGAADFTLYEDRVSQPIAHFSTSEEPLAVALLLDTSQSTRKFLGEIKSAAGGFLKQLRPQDRAIVVSFDFEVQTLCPLTADHRALEAGIKRAKAGARVGTKLRDAVRTIAVESLLGEGEPSRPAPRSNRGNRQPIPPIRNQAI